MPRAHQPSHLKQAMLTWAKPKSQGAKPFPSGQQEVCSFLDPASPACEWLTWLVCASVLCLQCPGTLHSSPLLLRQQETLNKVATWVGCRLWARHHSAFPQSLHVIRMLKEDGAPHRGLPSLSLSLGGLGHGEDRRRPAPPPGYLCDHVITSVGPQGTAFTFNMPFVILIILMNQGPSGYFYLFKIHCEMFFYSLSQGKYEFINSKIITPSC